VAVTARAPAPSCQAPGAVRSPLSVNVLSFSLYGADPLYCRGAVRNAELAPRIYPGWVVRFAVDDCVPLQVLDQLRSLGCEIVVMQKSLGPEYGKFWRYLVAADPSIERFTCRDADSRLNVREKAAVDEWIASGEPFHVMRDSFFHRRKRMMGGMWGGVGGALPDIAERIDAWGRYERWGDSDGFMSEIVWPLVADRCICHDSSNHFGDARSFPAHPMLDRTCHVGEIVPVDRPPLDVWREVGVLRDHLLYKEAEIARRDAEIDALRAELARCRDADAAKSSRRSLLRRALSRLRAAFARPRTRSSVAGSDRAC